MLLYNSATHKKEEFTTHTPGRVEMYTCGPTVYHFAHIVRIAGKTTHYADEVDQTSVENPTLEKLEALSQRVELLEKLLDEKFMEEKKERVKSGG